jgi:hypothetical protein
MGISGPHDCTLWAEQVSTLVYVISEKLNMGLFEQIGEEAVCEGTNYMISYLYLYLFNLKFVDKKIWSEIQYLIFFLKCV